MFCVCQAHGCSAAVFALPAVQAVIHYKWTSWARRFLLYELACYCCWLVSFTVFTLAFQNEDWELSFGQMLRDRWEWGARRRVQGGGGVSWVLELN
jgi:hypothetical protein